MTKKTTKNLKVFLICFGLVTISVVYVSAFTNSMAGKSFSSATSTTKTATASGVLTNTSINTNTSISTATATNTISNTATGIGDQINDEIAGISIFPNPVVDKLNIKYSTDAAATVTKIKVLNVTGECVYKGEKTNFIDMSTYSSGTYFIQFVDANLHTTTKSIVKVENIGAQ